MPTLWQLCPMPDPEKSPAQTLGKNLLDRRDEEEESRQDGGPRSRKLERDVQERVDRSPRRREGKLDSTPNPPRPFTSKMMRSCGRFSSSQRPLRRGLEIEHLWCPYPPCDLGFGIVGSDVPGEPFPEPSVFGGG